MPVLADRPRPPSTRRVAAGVLAVVAGSALHLHAQPQNPALTFDAALSVALLRNATLEGLGNQQAIWDARHARDATGPQADARVNAECGPSPVPAPVAAVSMPFTDSERLTAAQMLRRNLRQAFYDLMLSDEELQEAQGLIDFTSEFRPAGQEASDPGATRDSRRNALRVEIMLSRARVELICARGRRRMALAAVNAVLNRAPDVPLTIVGDLTDPVPLPSVEAAIRLSTAMDVELRQLRQGDPVQPGPPPSSGPPALPASPGRTPLYGVVARERALDAGMRERFARIDAGRHAAARFEDALLPAALDTLARTADEHLHGRADVMELLEARRRLGDLRRAYLHALHDLRLSEADVEERLPASGVSM
jgi:hypothetical protein